jgi:hypothetical protein
VSNPLSVEPTKSANSKEKSSSKKLKEIDRIAVSAGSGNSKRTMSSRYWHDVFFWIFHYPLLVTILVN